MIELEKTYLAKSIPDDLANHKRIEIIDLYIPSTVKHPILRLRKNGDEFEMTKKSPVNNNDASKQDENTIPLTQEEFEALSKVKGNKIHKYRYFYPYEGRVAEFDIFLDKFKGLVVVDIEFDNEEEKDDFEMPDFCLVEVTFENFIAAGMLSGKTYSDIIKYLDKLKYKKLKYNV